MNHFQKKIEYAKTVVAILPTDNNKLQNIADKIDNIKRGSGTWTGDGWFYGDSIYLSSTLYFSATPAGAGSVIDLEKITLSCSTNSGTTVSKISLLAVQTGPTLAGVFKEQTKTFDATAARTFDVPVSWDGVDKDSMLTTVGAYFDVTATRNGGGSSQFRFPNIL